MLPRHLAQGGGGGGLSSHSAARKFIDRFNATSAWVTASVLRPVSPQLRAAVYSDFATLAGFLEMLNNYNGVMAIVTALQQVCH